MDRHIAHGSVSVAERCGAWLDEAGLAGIALFFLLFQGALAGGVTLLLLGLYLWSWWLVLMGLLSLRLFAFLHSVGRHFFHDS